MTTYYQPPFVVVEDGSIVALQHIESMNLTRDGEEELVDRLKSDYLIKIDTTGGKSYVLSMNKQIEVLGKQYSISKDPKEVRDSIFNRWVRILNKTN